MSLPEIKITGLKLAFITSHSSRIAVKMSCSLFQAINTHIDTKKRMPNEVGTRRLLIELIVFAFTLCDILEECRNIRGYSNH